MKYYPTLLTLLCLTFILCPYINVYAGPQDVAPVSVTWELSNPSINGSGQNAVTSGPINAQNESLHNMRINGYSGAENSQRTDNRPPGGASQWPENQSERIDSVYIEFSLSPMPGSALSLEKIQFKIGGNSTNYMKADVLYSTDPDFNTYTQIPANLVLEGAGYGYPGHLLRADTLHQVTADINVTVNSDQAFYLRFYPWVHNQTSGLTGKYLLLQNLVISGQAEGEFAYELPSVSSGHVTLISTTFSTASGNITNDGGAPITQRGVVWNTTGGATTADGLTMDSTGTGAFVSAVTGLDPGTTFYLRAYGSNIAGTAYGAERTFTTLDAITKPQVYTSSIQNVTDKSAETGGWILDWGGAPITDKGVVWNTSGGPSLDDHVISEGEGTDNYYSLLYPLNANTTYYVRAYATNNAGTGYGNEVDFTTMTTQPDVVKIVDQTGNGDYTSVLAAFDDVPDSYTGKYTIKIKSGVYYEKLLLDRNKTNVVLEGVHPDSVILTFDDYAGKAGGTSQSYSVAIDADDFTAANITFQNTVVNDGSADDQQAVALRTNGDRQTYYNCKLLGYQDTYYTWGGRGTGRTYMKNCYIEGSVDFIFGRNIVLFDSCQLHFNRNGGSLTAASTEADSKYGYVFRDCIITHDEAGFDGKTINNLLLGRPWQAAPRTVFIRTEEPAALNMLGWAMWNVTPALYAEYQCYGAGYDTTYRSPISRQLSDIEAATYTIANIFAKAANPRFTFDWTPPGKDILTSVHDVDHRNQRPTEYGLEQNYPNPFNPVTNIRYSVPENTTVKLELYNVLGEKVMTLVDDQKPAGVYTHTLDGQGLASGVYFYRMQAGQFSKTIKTMLLK